MRVLVGLAVTVLFLSIVQSRTDSADLFIGADQGAFWAEHLERLGAASQSEGVWKSILEGNGEEVRSWIESVDRRFPPGLYLWGVIVGKLISHEASVICRSMSIWWLLLAAAAGLVSWCIADRARWSFVAGYAATLSLPGLGSLSLTYFFDLPMAALIWTAIAAWMLLERWPPLAGILAGMLLFGAGLFKWTALPIGGLMLACTVAAGLFTRRDRSLILKKAFGLVLAAGTMVTCFWLWGKQGGTSFDHMMSITATATVTAQVHTWEIGPWTLTTVDWENRRLAWYAVRSVTHVIGPLSFIPFAIGVVWGARGHAGWLCLLVVLLHALFYVGLIPPLDGRFLITAAPAGALVAATGWLRTGKKGLALATATLLASGITLAEFHHGERNRWNKLWPSDPEPGQALTGRGMFLDIGDRNTAGWPRAEATSSFLPEREALWQALTACEPSALLLPTSPFGQITDTTWLAYRHRLARIRGEALPGELVETGASWGAEEAPPELPPLPQRVLLLLGANEGEPPHAGPGWSLQGSYRSGERNFNLWSRGAGAKCDLSTVLDDRLPQESLHGATHELNEGTCSPPSDLLQVRPAPHPLPTQAATKKPGCRDLGASCSAFYVQAATRLPSEAVDCTKLLDQLDEARTADRSNEASSFWNEGSEWDADRLAEELKQRLGTDEARSLISWENTAQPTPGEPRRDLIIEDELLGPQRIALFLPSGSGPFPGIVGLLGHDQSVEQFMADHGGQEVVNAGIAVAVPIVRAYDSAEAEDAATRAMLCAGSSMMAVRVQEARNALGLLQSLPEVCADRLGVLAHSGGSLVANLLAWVQPELRGIVTDMEGRYNGATDASSSHPALLRDETHPGLRPINLRIINFEDAPVPTMRVRYGMPDGPKQAAGFLNHALRADSPVQQPPPLPPPQ
jgi:hypothetical protein